MTRIEVREVEFRIVIRRIFGIGETLHRRNVNHYRQNYDIVLVLHCTSTDSKHCLIDICFKFCFAPICLELGSLGFRSLSTVKVIVNAWRTLNRLEQLRHRPVSLWQHGLLVWVVFSSCIGCLLSLYFPV